MVFPMARNHVLLKSENCPCVSQKSKGYSSQLAPTRSKRMAVLKNYTMKVTVVVLDRRSVSVAKPTQSIRAIQIVLKMKLIMVNTYERPLTSK